MNESTAKTENPQAYDINEQRDLPPILVRKNAENDGTDRS